MKLTDAQLRDAVRNTHKANCEKCRPKSQPTPGYMEAYARLHRNPDDAHDLKSDTDHE